MAKYPDAMFRPKRATIATKNTFSRSYLMLIRPFYRKNTPSIKSIDPRKDPPLLELSSKTEHGLDSNAKKDHPDAGDGELGPRVQDPGVEQEDNTHVLRVTTALKALHEHVCARSVAEVVPLVLHVLNGHVALGRPVGLPCPALPGAAGVHVGAVLGHGVGAALLASAIPAHQVLRVKSF